MGVKQERRCQLHIYRLAYVINSLILQRISWGKCLFPVRPCMYVYIYCMYVCMYVYVNGSAYSVGAE